MKLLLYCTKEKNKYDRLVRDKHYGKPFYLYGAITENFESLNGKIVVECDYEVEEIGLVEIPDYAGDGCYMFVSDVNIYFETKTLNQDKLFKKSCLNWEEMEKYLYSTNGKGYAIHIKNLHIFDKPKELSDYYIKQCQFGKCSTCKYGKNDIHCATIDTPITKAPQNMMYAYDREGNKYILISIKPEWLCKILNGEKTIEVRKKVLKEMLK